MNCLLHDQCDGGGNKFVSCPRVLHEYLLSTYDLGREKCFKANILGRWSFHVGS